MKFKRLQSRGWQCICNSFKDCGRTELLYLRHFLCSFPFAKSETHHQTQLFHRFVFHQSLSDYFPICFFCLFPISSLFPEWLAIPARSFCCSLTDKRWLFNVVLVFNDSNNLSSHSSWQIDS